MKNASLTPLVFLIGKWRVEMRHVAIPKLLTWEDSFEWVADSFIIWHWQGKDEVPKATSIIGRNENKTGNVYTMLYFDSRGVSRIMEMSFENGIWRHLRLDSDFSQRFEGIVNKDGSVIKGKGEASKNGGKTWVHDFSITYTKIK
jgi:hypothetical protein